MKKLIIYVPEILHDVGIDFNELHYGARISLNTAKRWASEEGVASIDRIEIATLEKIANFLQLDVEDMIGFE